MVDITTMNKEQYVAWRVEKNGLESTDVEAMWEEYKGDAEAFGIETANIELYIKERFSQAFAKKALRKGAEPEKFKVIITGVTSSDYGASKIYNKAMEIVKSEDEGKIEAAIEAGMLNAERQPIFPPATKNENKRGNIINLSDEKQTTISVVSKRVEGEDKFKLGTIGIQSKQLREIPTLYSVNSVELVPGKNCTDILDTLYGNNETIFKEEKILSEDKIEELFKNFYENYIFEMEQLEEISQNYPDPEAGNWNKFVLVKANVVDINVTSEGKSNILTIISKLDEDLIATVWLPQEIPINFDYRAQNVWVYGTVSWDANNNMPVINGISLFVPEQFRVQEKAGEISPEKPKAPEPKVEEPKQEVKKDIEF